MREKFRSLWKSVPTQFSAQHFKRKGLHWRKLNVPNEGKSPVDVFVAFSCNLFRRDTRTDDISDWDQKFLGVDQSTLMELIQRRTTWTWRGCCA